jgi:hypothetical protein
MLVPPKAKVYMSGSEEIKEGLEEEMPEMTSAPKFCTVFSEAHPVALLQTVQEYLEDKDILPIINTDEWSVTYQCPMKLETSGDLEDDSGDSVEIDLKVRMDFQRVSAERVAIVFSSKDQCAGKWLLQEHFASVAKGLEDVAFTLTETETET